MLFTFGLSLVLGVTSVVSQPPRRTCGTYISDEHRDAAEAHFQANKQALRLSAASSPLAINVHWHVISENDTLAGGNVPDPQITDSIKVLNENHASSNTGISWTLAETTRTANADWFNKAGPNTTQQTAMKNALRKGGAADLNVYSVAFNLGPGVALGGYSTFPWDYTNKPMDDGVVVLYTTLPGGTFEFSNTGKNLLHEAGHWAGLYHPFQGGCTPPGDFVDDTPAWENVNFLGCPPDLKACNGELAPIHNYMAYSDDSCMNNFTPGQVARMREQLAMYRGL